MVSSFDKQGSGAGAVSSGSDLRGRLQELPGVPGLLAALEGAPPVWLVGGKFLERIIRP